MATLGTSTQPPINLHRLGWSSSLETERERNSKHHIWYDGSFYKEGSVSYLTCLTSCLMVLDREKVFDWIFLMATVLPSLEEEIILNKRCFSKNIHQSSPVCRCPSVDLFITVKWTVLVVRVAWVYLWHTFIITDTWVWCCTTNWSGLQTWRQSTRQARAGFTSWGGSGPSVVPSTIFFMLLP